MIWWLYIFEFVLVIGLLAFVIVNGYSIIFGAPFVASTDNRIKKMIDALDLKPGQKAVDLGSGNGAIVAEMTRRGIDAYGYEINPWLVWSSRKKGKIFWKDYWRENLKDFDGVTVYGIPYIMSRLEKKLWSELPKGAKIVSSSFKFTHKKPIRQFDHVYLYKV